MYITDTTNNRVQKLNRNAQSGETIINIQRPVSLALDDAESLYIYIGFLSVTSVDKIS